MNAMCSVVMLLLLLLPQAAQLQTMQFEEADWEAKAARLEMSRQHWGTHNIARYEFLLDLGCMNCAAYSPARVQVENGVIVAVLDPVSGAPMRKRREGPDPEGPVQFDWYRSVEQVFAEIERAISNRYGTTHRGSKARDVSVEYDSTYGYPAFFQVDYSLRRDADGNEYEMTDSRFSFRITEFKAEPLPLRGAWQRVPDAPLSPRNRATIAWAAGEIFVFGGLEHYCPPMAGCLPPATPPFSDGAAYDPQKGTWRRMADAPFGIIQAQTVTLDDAVFALARTSFDDPRMHLLRYQPDVDRWDEFALPDAIQEPRIAASDAGLLFFAYSDTGGAAREWRLDATSGEWTQLPDDPLGPAFGRQYVAVYDDLYLFDHELVPSPGSATPSLLRAARLRDQRWEVLPVANSIGVAPSLIMNELLIAPALGCADGGGTNGWGECVPFGAMFDTANDTWRELPNAPRRGYKHVQSSGAFNADGLVLGTPGHPALDAMTFEWFTVPALDTDRNVERSIVAVGPYGFAFGGARPGGVLMNEAWIWRP